MSHRHGRRRGRATPLENRREVSRHVEPEIDDAVARALASGATPPLRYQGAGASGIVLCDRRGHAFKVGRIGTESSIQAEAEWLATALKVPGVRQHVARLYRFHPTTNVIERECVHRTQDPRGLWGVDLWGLYQGISQRMWARGWSPVEYKDDSFVETADRRFVLVDAGRTYRMGPRLVQHAEELLAGRRPWGWDTPQDLVFEIRREISDGRLEPGPRVEAVLEALAAPAADRARLRASARGFANVEGIAFVAGGTVGFAVAPRLNAVVRARPLGRYVPPSAAASVGAIVAGAIAHRAGMRSTAAAVYGVGAGLAIGTVASARRPGGLLAHEGRA